MQRRVTVDEVNGGFILTRVHPDGATFVATSPPRAAAALRMLIEEPLPRATVPQEVHDLTECAQESTDATRS